MPQVREAVSPRADRLQRLCATVPELWPAQVVSKRSGEVGRIAGDWSAFIVDIEACSLMHGAHDSGHDGGPYLSPHLSFVRSTS